MMTPDVDLRDLQTTAWSNAVFEIERAFIRKADEEVGG
jgi:hypothetical protein